ncbi:S41 family peptidase [Arthrobacter sp. B1805]|uniref:S41 family peptidase n=1 Tax=Arthrobacter sp. B1805 TaxID=2058892 RepID=UPI000CE46EC8|nr:S41 family peptidase [Arthrobacter sp. B1805]
MGSDYLRYPHIHGNRVAFVAENDVWVAPLDGGRAWRISALQLPARNPRFSPDGSTIAWTVVQGGAPEVVAADVEGGNFRRLTFWGHQSTRVKGFTSEGDVLATSAFRQEDSRLSWAYRVPLDGTVSSVVPLGPVDTVVEGPALGDEKPVVIGSVLTREPAWWKRYRGGTAGKLWMDSDGRGDFVRFLPELDGNLSDPMWIAGRVAFLSDHEGHGNLYSADRNGGDLRRHTDHDQFYARHASTDGTRIAFESAGELWYLPALDADAIRLSVTLGSASTTRRPQPLAVERHLAAAVPTSDGSASIVEAHGTLHWLTHKDGPSRVVEATPGVRARLGRPIDRSRVAYIADVDGEEALYVRDVFAPADGEATADQSELTGRSEHAGSQHVGPGRNGAELNGSESDSDGVQVLPAPVSALSLSDGPHRPYDDGASGGASDEASDTAPGGGDAGSRARLEQPDDGASGPEAALVDAQSALPRSSLQRFTFEGRFRASAVAVSPDGSRIAVPSETGSLELLTVATGESRRVVSTEHGVIEAVTFSHDSAWLAWAEPMAQEGARSRIRLASASAPDEIIDVTDGRFRDWSPTFSRDGKYLAFLSDRSFDPVYDTHRFDLSFPASTKPHLVALAAGTPSPFGPRAALTGGDTDRNDGRGSSGAPGAPGAAGSAGSEGRDGEEAPATVVVDPELIMARTIAVPVAQGTYDDLRAVDGALLWTAGDIGGVTGEGRASSSDGEPARRLERFDLERRRVEVLAADIDAYEVSRDGATAVHMSSGKVTAIPTDGATDTDSPKRVEVGLQRIRVSLDPVRVWRQAFEEAWRLQRDFYWTEDMAGVDWHGVRERYLPLVDRLGSHDDLVDVLWELHGELGTSHAYVAPALVGEAGGHQGFLGAEFAPARDGWAVTRIFEAESSDPLAASPLSAPGVAVRAGDVIEAIDGVPVPARFGPSVLLTGAAGMAVELTVRPGDGAERRRVAVVPLRSEERLRYQNWVAANRAIVQRASDGRFGYLHIPDMVANGWGQLHRDLDRETTRDALVIDVRRNRGGHTSQLVAELIGRRVTAWSMPRGETPGTYPAHAPRGPVVVLTDEFAGSDGDIITQVVKLRGIGPVIGTRTWGGVIGIDGRFKLADGTGVNQPRYGFHVTGGVGWSIENYGVDPDIEVPFPPHAYAAGEDPQLEHGVGILREMLAEIPTDIPPLKEGYPSRKPGSLPPRPQDLGD